MYAYRLPDAGVPMEASDHPSMRRLLPAGPWQYAPHLQGGTLATWKGESQALADYGPPQETQDGLIFYPPKGELALDKIAKACSNATPVQLSSGITINIALAESTPRKLVFGAKSTHLGDYMSEFANLAESLRDRIVAENRIRFNDPEVHRCVLLAIQQGYRVTEEALTVLGWVSTEDFHPILMAAWGYDPKADAADSAT